MLTTPYVYSAVDATKMAMAGADIIVGRLGLTTGGAIGAKTAKTLDQCITEIDAWSAAAHNVNPDVIVLCHGGPIAMPDDADHVPARMEACHGCYGTSSMERLPTEIAIRDQVARFVAIRGNPTADD